MLPFKYFKAHLVSRMLFFFQLHLPGMQLNMLLFEQDGENCAQVLFENGSSDDEDLEELNVRPKQTLK